MGRQRNKSGTSAKVAVPNIDPEAPDPKYVDDGSPVAVRLNPDQTRTWMETSHLADIYRANMHVQMQRMSELAGNDVVLYGNGNVLLYHHRRDSAKSGET